MNNKFNVEDYIGKVYGKLTILKEESTYLNNRLIRKFICQCECGNITNPKRLYKLKEGRTISCGICNKDLHGQTNTPTHKSWLSMMDRCVYRNHPNYKGRGITICERWYKFSNFLEDMGERPMGTTLDRINVNGNYEPSNVKWSTPKEQRLNQREPLKVCPICGYEIKNGYDFNMKQHIEAKHPNHTI